MKWDIHPGIGDYVFLADRAAEKSRMLFFLQGAIMLFLPLPRVHSEYNQLRINMISDFRRISNLPCMLAKVIPMLEVTNHRRSIQVKRVTRVEQRRES